MAKIYINANGYLFDKTREMLEKDGLAKGEMRVDGWGRLRYNLPEGGSAVLNPRDHGITFKKPTRAILDGLSKLIEDIGV